MKIQNQLIYNEDFLKSDRIKTSQIDLTITSPPYNLEKDYGEYQDNKTYEDYLEFSRSWLEKVYQITKPNGRLCVNLPLDTNKGGIRPVYSDVYQKAKEVGWKYRHTILWVKGLSGTAWGSWLSPSAPNIQTSCETILVLYKDSWKISSADKKSDLTPFEFMEWTQGVWKFRGEPRNGHPAPFPLELPYRCLKLFSFVGDSVLDCFSGTGTTLDACILLNRLGYGFEIDKVFYNNSINRLRNGKFRIPELNTDTQITLF